MKKILFLVLAVLGLASCQMLETEPEIQEAVGQLQLSVKIPESLPSRSGNVNTDDFEVIITGPDNFEASYTVGNLPETLTLPVGQYVVQACTPGEFGKRMDYAYYLGRENMDIQAGITTQTEVICKQQNIKFQINYEESFIALFQNWTITVDDGDNSVLTFSEDKTLPSVIYWKIGENVTTFSINIEAQPKEEGTNLVKGRMSISKADASENYDGDTENYMGGDAVLVNVSYDPNQQPSSPGNPQDPSGPSNPGGSQNPSEPSNPGDSQEPSSPSNPEGSVDPDVPVVPENPSTPSTPSTSLGLNVTSNIIFANTDVVVEIPVVWDTDEPIVTPDPDEGSGSTSMPTIVFTSSSVVASADGTGPALDATITAESGLKSIIVKAESDGGFQDLMVELEESGLMLINGHELVGDEILPVVFAGLNMEVSFPEEGDVNYIFNIANFYQFLGMSGAGSTIFSIDVTDLNGNTVSGSVTVTIVE